MDNTKNKYKIPSPVLNNKEIHSINKLTEQYKKISKPGLVGKVGNGMKKVIPKGVKKKVSEVKKGLTEKELYIKCMKIVADGFGVLEKKAASFTISQNQIIESVNAVTKENEISEIDEICLARGYKVAELVNKYNVKNIGLAAFEGGTTGALGFAGIPFNIVFSTFVYYRAVQTIAMFYGYDIKNDPAELIISSEVFINALSPGSSGNDEISGLIGKIMVMTEVSIVKQTANKTWSAMAERGTITLLLAQMRALANKSAQKAVENAGKKGLENSVFRDVFEQIGKKLTLKNIGQIVPVVGAAVGALFDISQMNTIITYADIFYHKRFLAEKEQRINILLGNGDDIVADIPKSDVIIEDEE